MALGDTFFSFWGSQLIIGIIAQSHILIGAALTGLIFIAVTAESIYYFTGNKRWDKMAHGIAKAQVITFAPGSFIAIMFVLVLLMLWPLFWTTIFRITFWPFVMEAASFVLYILYLYTWYYTWDTLKGFRALHLSTGFLLMFVAWAQQFMVDIVASYMLTPTTPDSLQSIIFNPTDIVLDFHRVVGNISYGGFLIAAFASWRFLRARSLEEKAFWDFVGGLGLLFGIGLMMLQPFIGWQYAALIREHAPSAFFRIMSGGDRSFLFLIQVCLLTALFFFSAVYITAQMRKANARHARAAFTLMALMIFFGGWLCLPPHWSPNLLGLDLSFLGQLGLMNPWKYASLAGLTLSGFLMFGIYLGAIQSGLKWGARGILPHIVLLLLGVLVIGMMVDMGIIREESRRPFLIYGRMYIQPQSPDMVPTNEYAPPTRDIRNKAQP
jgi:cytochrome d ubiquinol oxidase subunit I